VSTRELVTFWLAVSGYLLICVALWCAVVLAVLWVWP